MRITRTVLRLLPLAAVASLIPAGPAGAQGYPARPVRLVHGFASGAAIDVFARPVAAKLTELLKVQVVVDPRPGATGTIANELVAKSAPDGYTILMAPSSAVTATPHLFRINYRALEDFVPIAQIGEFPFVMVVHPSVPARTVKEFVALARAKPGLTYGTPGIGTGFHLGAELFAQVAGISLLHVPYKGGGTAATTDLIGGRLDIMWDSLGVVLPFLQAKRLRAIAVTGAQPSHALPGVPTVRESGYPDYVAGGWHGLFAPAATSKEIVAQLNAAVGQALATSEVGELWKSFAMDIVPMSPEAFAAKVKADYERYGKLIRSTGVKVE